MFDDRDRGNIIAKLTDQFVSRVGVVDIVVGEGFALQLARRGDAGAAFSGDIAGGFLMRVLTVTKGLAKLSTKANPIRS